MKIEIEIPAELKSAAQRAMDAMDALQEALYAFVGDGKPVSPEPKPVSVWPKRRTGPDGTEYWVDATSTVYSEALHSWSAADQRPSVTSLGLFRKRRAQKQEGQLPSLPERHEASSAVESNEERLPIAGF